MFLSYFTEQPMNAYPEDEGLKAGYTSVLFSNKHFDPVEGSRLYNERLAEYILADEVGFDGIMLNEHHNAPYCMQPRITVWSSILAAVTKNVSLNASTELWRRAAPSSTVSARCLAVTTSAPLPAKPAVSAATRACTSGSVTARCSTSTLRWNAARVPSSVVRRATPTLPPSCRVRL